MTTLKNIRRPVMHRDVALSGDRTVRVYALKSSESLAITEAIPEPQPPMRPDPKGPHLDWKPDENEPAYRKKLADARIRRTIAEVAVAIRLDMAEDGAAPDTFDPGDTPEKAKAAAQWLERACAALRESMTEQEIMVLWNVTTVLAGPGAVNQYLRTLVIEIADNGSKREVKRVLPEAYALTEEALLLAAAARFGQDPTKWPQTLTAEQKTQVLAYELLAAEQEQARAVESAKLSALLEGLLGVLKR